MGLTSWGCGENTTELNYTNLTLFLKKVNIVTNITNLFLSSILPLDTSHFLDQNRL
jgi:hypothetical protein